MGKRDERRVMGDKEKPAERAGDYDIVDEQNDEADDEDDDEKMIEGEQDEENDTPPPPPSDTFKHVRDENEAKKSDKQIYDAAHDQQQQQQQQRTDVEKKKDEEAKKDGPQNDEPIDDEERMQGDEDETNERPTLPMLKPKSVNPDTSKKQANSKKTEPEQNGASSSAVEPPLDGQLVETMGAARGQSMFSTNMDFLQPQQQQHVVIDREQVERELIDFRDRTLSGGGGGGEDEKTEASLNLWLDYERLTHELSKELCEQLRLILEPTVCAKLKGDYKTGKRLSMRRVVEYIATEYRKDKIWLRRTKPNKRDYQVVLAVDNSSSMSDNHCMQLAYETIATLTNAFQLLEVGELGLLSFGESCRTLHALGDTFNAECGARTLASLDFTDTHTHIVDMLHFSLEHMFATNGKQQQQKQQQQQGSSTTPVSKLLVVLSDGKGIFYDGYDRVRNTVQHAIQSGIFILFVILDSTASKSSIFDIKMPIFVEGSNVRISNLFK